MEIILILVALSSVLLFLVVLVLMVRLLLLWLRAALSGTPVTMLRIIAIRLRGNPPSLLIDAYIALKRADASTTLDDVENVYIESRSRVATSDDLAELVKLKEHAR